MSYEDSFWSKPAVLIKKEHIHKWKKKWTGKIVCEICNITTQEEGLSLGEEWKPKTQEPYDIIGGDHVKHVQKKLDDSGLSATHEIILPKTNELQIDYDSPELPEQFKLALNFLTQAYCKLGEVITYKVTESISGNRHVTISIPKAEFTPVDRIAWQAIFGSDFKREALGMMSAVRGLKNPSLLIEKKFVKPLSEGFSTPSLPKEPTGRKFREE